MERRPEPELMTDVERATAFDRAERSYGSSVFLDWYGRLCGVSRGHVVDLGTGPADYLVRLATRYPSLTITGYDGSPAMCEIARANVERARLASRITVERRLFDEIDARADCVVSTNTLHHLSDPSTLWRAVKRIARPGARALVSDLGRPPSLDHARRIVAAFAATGSALYREDFLNSLCAAYTGEEVRQQLQETGLELPVRVEGDPTFLHAVVVCGMPTPA